MRTIKKLVSLIWLFSFSLILATFVLWSKVNNSYFQGMKSQKKTIFLNFYGNYKMQMNSVTKISRLAQGNGISKILAQNIKHLATEVHQSKILSKDILSYIKGNFTVGDVYEKGFYNPNEDICADRGKDQQIIILVASKASHQTRREAIRQSWGLSALRMNVSVGFVIGRTLNESVHANIIEESKRYRDIIQANFLDSYKNLTLKTIAMLEWTKTYCTEVSFLLKTDDDAFINVPRLLIFIRKKINFKNTIFGHLKKKSHPVRDKRFKCYVSTSTYTNEDYPKYIQGLAYLLTNDVIKKIYNKALNTTYFFIEDVFISGLIAESLNIKRVDSFNLGKVDSKVEPSCKLLKNMAIHGVSVEWQILLNNFMLKKWGNCTLTNIIIPKIF